MIKNFLDYLYQLNLSESINIIVHSSYKRINSTFLQTAPNDLINSLKNILTKNGSIIFPTFTYCFKKSSGDYEVFDRLNSKSKVGLLSETFRLSEGVIRTSSPTHSFALWGNVTKYIDENNSPESPLGKESVLDWFTHQPNSFVFMLGTDFSSLTYGHYLEIAAKVPWYDYSPWDYLNVLPIGVSISGEQQLKEIPGCAKGFIKFEEHLLENNLIKKFEFNGLSSYLIRIKLLYDDGIKYFSENYRDLLCAAGTCPACDSRREKFL